MMRPLLRATIKLNSAFLKDSSLARAYLSEASECSSESYGGFTAGMY